MRDVIWTIIITWLVWKLWSFFSTSRSIYIQKNEQHYYSNENNGETKFVKKTSEKKKIFRDNEGEYVDFEEIKK